MAAALGARRIVNTALKVQMGSQTHRPANSVPFTASYTF